MRLNARLIGGGVAAAVGAGLGYLLLTRNDEQTEFATITREGAFSVRDYPRLLVAEIWTQGMRELALARGFTTLADYIFGKNRDSGRIPMTVPVLADGDEDGRGWRTRFVMPAHIRPEALPAPDEGVMIRSLPARRIAALRFNGASDDAALLSHEAQLRHWMAMHGLHAAGPVEHAFYNSPFTPAPLRRNEVLIPLAA